MKTDDRLFTTLTKAIEDRDYQQIGEVVDYLRFRQRANYQQCFELAKSLTGISEADWDALLYEADQANGGRESKRAARCSRAAFMDGKDNGSLGWIKRNYN